MEPPRSRFAMLQCVGAMPREVRESSRVTRRDLPNDKGVTARTDQPLRETNRRLGPSGRASVGSKEDGAPSSPVSSTLVHRQLGCRWIPSETESQLSDIALA